MEIHTTVKERITELGKKLDKRNVNMRVTGVLVNYWFRTHNKRVAYSTYIHTVPYIPKIQYIHTIHWTIVNSISRDQSTRPTLSRRWEALCRPWRRRPRRATGLASSSLSPTRSSLKRAHLELSEPLLFLDIHELLKLYEVCHPRQVECEAPARL